MSDSYWVYGIHAVDAVLTRSPYKVEALLVQQGRSDDRVGKLIEHARQQGIVCQSLARAELDEIVQGNHQGVIAKTRGGQTLREKDLEQLLDTLVAPPLLLILDGVTDPHNLGACLRTADAAGVHGVIAPKDKSAGLNATVRKVACGAAEVRPFFQVTNLARTMQTLQQRGIWIVGTAGESEQSLYDVDFVGPIALVMGAEGAGMRRLTRERCDYLVSLPMLGSVSSLNVSVAAGVCLFEAVRQRAG